MWQNIKNFFKKSIGSETVLSVKQEDKQLKAKKVEPKIKQFKKQACYKKEATYC